MKAMNRRVTVSHQRLVARDEIALRGGGKEKHRQKRDEEDEDGFGKSDINQQQIRVEDKEEGQQGRTDVIGKALHARHDRIARG